MVVVVVVVVIVVVVVVVIIILQKRGLWRFSVCGNALLTPTRTKAKQTKKPKKPNVTIRKQL